MGTPTMPDALATHAGLTWLLPQSSVATQRCFTRRACASARGRTLTRCVCAGVPCSTKQSPASGAQHQQHGSAYPVPAWRGYPMRHHHARHLWTPCFHRRPGSPHRRWTSWVEVGGTQSRQVIASSTLTGHVVRHRLQTRRWHRRHSAAVRGLYWGSRAFPHRPHCQDTIVYIVFLGLS
jgi:hypothetical protein